LQRARAHPMVLSKANDSVFYALILFLEPGPDGFHNEMMRQSLQ